MPNRQGFDLSSSGFYIQYDKILLVFPYKIDIKQTGDFVDFSESTLPEFHGEDDFVLIDGYLSYNLPNRLGKVSLGVKNLFDEDFQYEDRENNTVFNPDQDNIFFELSPERSLYGKFLLHF